MKRIGILVVLALSAGLLVATPAAAAPAITVTPNSELPDTAVVTVAGGGFTPSGTAHVRQCGRSNAVLRCGEITAATVSDAGTFSTNLLISRVFISGDSPIDCGGTGCVIFVLNAGIGENVFRPITFASGLPKPAPAPTVTTVLIPVPAASPQEACKKGFRTKKVRGKQKCVRRKRSVKPLGGR